jgi:predicted chitinase
LATTENGRRAIAESNNYNVEALTRAINGGDNGLQDRIRRTNDLLTKYNYS